MSIFLLTLLGTLAAMFVGFMCQGLLGTERGYIWLYKQVLKLYPKQHLVDFGDEMLDDFSRRCREQEDGLFGIVCEFWDAIRNATPMMFKALLGNIQHIFRRISVSDLSNIDFLNRGMKSAMFLIGNAVISAIVVLGFRIIIEVVFGLLGTNLGSAFATGDVPSNSVATIAVPIVNILFFIGLAFSLVFILLGALQFFIASLATLRDENMTDG